MKPYAELLEFNQPSPIFFDAPSRRNDRIRANVPELTKPITPADNENAQEWYFDPERISEYAGRWDYGQKNSEKVGQEAKSGGSMIQKWIDSGEQSMLEMGHATFFIECSRVVSHELVRHRLASFQQESQRFTLQVLEEDSFYSPDNLTPAQSVILGESYRDSAIAYERLLGEGVPKQIARYVLPNGTKTRIIMSANLREWRHIIKLRLHTSAQPEMRELMQQIYDQLVEVFPQSLAGVLEEGRGVR